MPSSVATWPRRPPPKWVRKIACAYCGVDIGRKCVGSRGQELESCHTDRIAAFIVQLEMQIETL